MEEKMPRPTRLVNHVRKKPVAQYPLLPQARSTPRAFRPVRSCRRHNRSYTHRSWVAARGQGARHAQPFALRRGRRASLRRIGPVLLSSLAPPPSPAPAPSPASHPQGHEQPCSFGPALVLTLKKILNFSTMEHPPGPHGPVPRRSPNIPRPSRSACHGSPARPPRHP